MEKLNDIIHKCDDCEYYPCSTQDIVSKGDICKDCPVICCREVLVLLASCEENIFEKGKYGELKMKENGWCYYYNEDTKMCEIYEIRPITCRIASCRFIREGKIPDEVKKLKLLKSEEQ